MTRAPYGLRKSIHLHLQLIAFEGTSKVGSQELFMKHCN